MAYSKGNVPYTPYATVDDTGDLGSPMGVHANPDDFGAQVGGAMKNTGNVVSALALKQQGMINETLATNAETDYMTDLGKLTGDYRSLQGLDAVAALPKYTDDVRALRQQYRANLPPATAHSFDMLVHRHESYALLDSNTYAATQVKKADYTSAATGIAASVTNAGSLPVATNDTRFGETLGDIQAHTARSFNGAAGIVEGKDGTFNFANTPEGVAAKTDFNSRLTAATGLAWQNRIKAISDVDPEMAQKKFEENKGMIPLESQGKIAPWLTPKVRDFQARGQADTAITNAEVGHNDVVKANAQPKSPVDVIMKNELHADGVIRVHSDGDGQAIGGINSNAYPEQFAEAKDILATKGQDAARDYIKEFYQKEIVDKNSISALPAAVQDVVADGIANHRAGFQTELLAAAKGGASRDQLLDMRQKEYDRLAATGEAKYVKAKPGWDNRIASLRDAPASTSQTAEFEASAASPIGKANYYRENYTSILQNAASEAEKKHPGDIEFAEKVRTKTEQKMNDIIRQQELSYTADANRVLQAVNGNFTKGDKPTSIDQLRNISPEVNESLDNVLISNPKLYDAIETRVFTENSRMLTPNNSSNYAYNLKRTLQDDMNNQLYSEFQIHNLLSRKDASAINLKDSNDLRKAMELPPQQKRILFKTMKDIESAGGNVDGLGSDRAVQFYNAANEYIDTQTKAGKQLSDILNSTSKDYAGNLSANYMPSRSEQMAKSAQDVRADHNAKVPVLTTKDQFDALKSGDEYVRNGIRYRKP